MRITVVTGVFSKERTFFFYDLVKSLAGFGAEVTVVAAYPDKNESEEVRRYCLEHPTMRLFDGVWVHWAGPVSREGNRLFVRMLRYLRMTVALYRKAKRTDADVYYLYSTPPFLGYIGILLARRAPTLYDAQDLFPDSLVHVKGYRENSLLIRFLRRLERLVYQKNSHINVISNDMRNTVIANGCPAEKVGVIFYGSNTAEINHVPRAENRLFDQYGISRDSFIISYGGSIRYLQRWSALLDAAEILRQRLPQVQFVIFGDGTAAEDLRKEVAARGLDSVRLFPSQPSTRMSELYSLGDLELVTLERQVTRFALPSKLWMIMAAGSPTLAILDDRSEIADILRENDLGYVLDTHDGAELAGFIERIYPQRGSLREMGERARRYVEVYHDLEEHHRMYYREMEKLAENRRAGV